MTVHPAVPVLAEHEVTRWSRNGTLAHCVCGTAVACTDAGDEYAAHLAEALAAAGLLPADPAAHVYLSTGCLHGDHDYCQATVGGVGRKVPATCKFCGAPCVCDCHAPDLPPGAVRAWLNPADVEARLHAPAPADDPARLRARRDELEDALTDGTPPPGPDPRRVTLRAEEDE